MVKNQVKKTVRRVGGLLRASRTPPELRLLHDDSAGSELAMLKTFAAIDSSTTDVTGVNRMQDLVAAHLADLGFTIERTRVDPRFGDLIVAERPAAAPNRRAGWITLVTHVDTVLPNFREFTIDPRSGRAYGSGVIDNKGGLTVGLGALARAVKAMERTVYGLRVICSPNEEVGSIGFTERFRALARDTVIGLGLEPALDDGSIIHQRRGNRWYDVEVVGREAHAGRSYGRHANAAHDLARKITRLAKLTDYRRHVSVSVGGISGGQDKHNIVCGVARAKVDARFASFAARDRLHRRITGILSRPFERSICGTFQTTTTFTVVDDCPPFGLTKRSKRLARAHARAVAQIEGRPVTSKIAGGAGDVNYLSTDDNIVLDGLGPVGGEMHTKDEWLDVATLDTRARALAALLLTLQRG